MRTQHRVQFISLLLSTSLALAAPPAPKDEQVAAALAVIVAHGSTLSEFHADTIVKLLKQTGLEASVPLDVRPLRRRAACFMGNSKVLWALTAVRDAQQARYREYREFAPSLAELKNSDDRQLLQTREYFELTVAEADFKGFRIVATGVGDLEGEEWSITGIGPATHTRTVCDAPPEPTTPVREDDLAHALATLSRSPRVNRPGQLFASVVSDIVGRGTDGALDEARLLMLVARVKAAGGDLRPVMQPVLDRIERSRCLGLQDAAVSELDLLARLYRKRGIVHATPAPLHYVFSKRVEGARFTYTATGTGPMKGDVMTVSVEDIVTRDFEYCANKKAPPLAK